MHFTRRLGLAFAALLLALSSGARALDSANYGQCQEPPPTDFNWPGRGATVVAVTTGEVNRTYTCGNLGEFFSATDLFDQDQAESPLPIGAMRVAVNQTDRVVEWFQPGAPDQPTGALTILQGREDPTPPNVCYSGRGARRQTADGEGFAQGIAYVNKQTLTSMPPPDCTGKQDGDQVNVTYSARFVWYGCANNPFEDPAPPGPLNPASYQACDPARNGSFWPVVGATVAEMVGANITRTYTCGKEGRSIKTTFWDLQDPSAELGSMVVGSPDQVERVAEFHAPGKPDEPAGSLVILESTRVDAQGPAQACFIEPDSMRQTKGGVGVFQDVRYVLKRNATLLEPKPDCATKQAGDTVQERYVAFFQFGACSNNPFEEAQS